MTRKIKDTIKQAALWVVAVTATMFIVCSVMGGILTPMDALNMFGCFRLSARIADLRKMGYKVKTRIVSRNRKNYAEYYLEAN